MQSEEIPKWEINMMCEQLVSEILKLAGPVTKEIKDECVKLAKQYVSGLVRVD